MVRSLLAVTLVLLALAARAQSPPDPNYVRLPVFDSYADFKSELDTIVATTDATARTTRLNTLWTTLKNAGQVPYAQGDQYAFLYRGSATSIAFPGDANGWNPSGFAGTKLAGTDLWIYEGRLAADARVDYKIVRNGSWDLDLNNPLQMWSGFGPNSELRMPTYDYPEETIRRTGVDRGTLGANVRIRSNSLSYDVNYRVYTPAGYAADELADLPVVYVTDGHEYAADHMGSKVAVLDNLIDDGSLRPTMAVFIDPRDSNNQGNNRRQSEYVSNPNFANFVASELVPAIDAGFRTDPTAENRVILGTSLGGINSAYFVATKGDVFGKIAIQSPSNSASIVNLYRKSPTNPLEIYMTSGTINDGSAGPTFAGVFQQYGYDYTFTRENQGHSWGNWRGELKEILLALVGPPEKLAGDFNKDGQIDAADYTTWRDGLGGAFTAEDYNIWVSAFLSLGEHTQGNAAAVPEPATFLLAIIGIVRCLVRIR